MSVEVVILAHVTLHATGHGTLPPEYAKVFEIADDSEEALKRLVADIAQKDGIADAVFDHLVSDQTVDQSLGQVKWRFRDGRIGWDAPETPLADCHAHPALKVNGRYFQLGPEIKGVGQS